MTVDEKVTSIEEGIDFSENVVLVADGERDLAGLIASQIQRYSSIKQVIVVTSPHNVINIAKLRSPKIIFLDSEWKLKPGYGLALYEELRQDVFHDNYQPQVVGMSGHPHLRESWEKRGCLFLERPYSIMTFQALLRTLGCI